MQQTRHSDQLGTFETGHPYSPLVEGHHVFEKSKFGAVIPKMIANTREVVYQLWPILDALNIRRCGLHAFSHCVASFIVDAGYAPEVAQQQLHHSNARTTLGLLASSPRRDHRTGDDRRRKLFEVWTWLNACER